MLSNTFYDELTSVISNFSERSRQVIQRRLGFNGISDSLETIAKDFSVTRERVRQIEVICLEAISKNCGSTLVSKLKKCLANRRHPLYLNLLEVEDEWFIGFLDNPNYLARLIGKLTTYCVFEIDGQQVISRINREQWYQLKFQTLEHLRLQITAKLLPKEVKQLIRNTAAEHGASELTNLLHESLQDKLHFCLPKGKGPKVLCSVGRGLTNVLTVLLAEATEPLHYTEIARRCSARLGHHVEGYVHNNLKGLASIYGRGIYGTLDHFPINDNDKKDILAATEAIILKGPKGRQWTCSELLKILKDKNQNLSVNLDKYILNIILTDSTVLNSVGRLVWVKKSENDQTKVLRIDLQNTVTEIIEKAGKALSAQEIKQIITKQRGLDEYFTILPSTQIARVQPNIWGLVDRDFLLTEVKQHKVLDALCHQLEQRQEGLHITELGEVFSKEGITVPRDFTNYMAMNLAQTDTRFRVRRGQILGLSTWQDAKRLSVKQAIEQIANNMSSPMTMGEIRQSIEEIVKHDVKQPLHRLLEHANLMHDMQSNTWYSQEQ